MSDGMGREFTYLSSHATNRYFIPNWGMFMGNKFSKWNMMRMQINAARQNPKITSDPRWSEVEKMVKQENDVLMHAVRHSLTLWQND